MLEIVMTSAFRRDFRRCIRRGLPREELEEIATLPASRTALPERCAIIRSAAISQDSGSATSAPTGC